MSEYPKPYRPAGQPSGPDVGCVWGLVITIVLAVAAGIIYWALRR